MSVRASIGCAARLLRRHVGDGADGRAGVGQHPARRRGRRGFVGLTRGDLGDAEIHQLRLAARGQEHVRRLDVAMDDAERVGRVERIGERCADCDDLGQRQRPALEAVLQGLAFEQYSMTR